MPSPPTSREGVCVLGGRGGSGVSQELHPTSIGPLYIRACSKEHVVVICLEDLLYIRGMLSHYSRNSQNFSILPISLQIITYEKKLELNAPIGGIPDQTAKKLNLITPQI